VSAATKRAEHRCFGGRQGFYEHASDACAGPMRFAVFLPPAALDGQRVPAVYFLPGLTSTEENFVVKAGAQRLAAELGLALVSVDTSPRAARFPGDDEAWDFGQGAGYYLDATQAPWSAAYQMATWVTRELPAVVEASFPIRGDARGLMGHSMGGHGALTLGLKHPERYRSLSAFAPIASLSRIDWGRKCLPRLLGDDPAAWAAHDAVELLKTRRFPGTILVDQGAADNFLERLQPEALQAACEAAGQPLSLRMRDGYDHGYFFVASFVDDHLRHHAASLGSGGGGAP